MAGLRGVLTGTLALVALEVAVTEGQRGNRRLNTLLEAPGAALQAFMSADRPAIPDTTVAAAAAPGGGGPKTLAPGPLLAPSGYAAGPSLAGLAPGLQAATKPAPTIAPAPAPVIAPAPSDGPVLPANPRWR